MLVDAGVSSASTTAALRQHRIAAVLELAMERNPTGGNRSGAKAMTHCDALSSNTEDASVNEALGDIKQGFQPTRVVASDSNDDL